MDGGNHLLNISQKGGGLHRLPKFTREVHLFLRGLAFLLAIDYYSRSGG